MTHHVYSRCNGGHGIYLQTEFTGSKWFCEKFIRDRVRQGRPTHFLFISRMDHDKATRCHL